jgi:hypothetical protein
MPIIGAVSELYSIQNSRLTQPLDLIEVGAFDLVV